MRNPIRFPRMGRLPGVGIGSTLDRLVTLGVTTLAVGLAVAYQVLRLLGRRGSWADEP